MKDKVLRANLTHAVETFCKELRAYSADSMVCNITIITKASGVAADAECDPLLFRPLPDWYKVRVVPTEAVDQDDSIIDESAKIFYGHDHYGNEGILKVVTYKETPEEDEEEKGEEDGP